MTNLCLKNAILDRPNTLVHHTAVHLPASASALRPGDNPKVSQSES